MFSLPDLTEPFLSMIRNGSWRHYSITTRQDSRRVIIRFIEVFYRRWNTRADSNGLPPTTAMANVVIKKTAITSRCPTHKN